MVRFLLFEVSSLRRVDLGIALGSQGLAVFVPLRPVIAGEFFQHLLKRICGLFLGNAARRRGPPFLDQVPLLDNSLLLELRQHRRLYDHGRLVHGGRFGWAVAMALGPNWGVQSRHQAKRQSGRHIADFREGARKAAPPC